MCGVIPIDKIGQFTKQPPDCLFSDFSILLIAKKLYIMSEFTSKAKYGDIFLVNGKV